MDGIVKVKNIVRDFCRKQDEIVSPILKFIWSLIVFISVQKMFAYSDLGSKKEITVLLAVLAALLPDAFMFVMVGALVALHTFSVGLEVGAVFVVMYLIMYCVYVRFFPQYAYAVFLVPVFYLIGIPYAAPIAIGLVAGFGGIVPAVMGIVLYYFSESTKEIARLLATEDVENEIEALKQLSNGIIHNKEMFAAIIIFSITILAIAVLLKFTFDYAIYVAIAAGTVLNILAAIFAGYIMNQDVPMDMVVIGSIIGIILAAIIRFGQGILDYKHTERVQFEDDDYYYYVKAVPKIDAEKKKKPKVSNKIKQRMEAAEKAAEYEEEEKAPRRGKPKRKIY